MKYLITEKELLPLLSHMLRSWRYYLGTDTAFSLLLLGYLKSLVGATSFLFTECFKKKKKKEYHRINVQIERM